MKMVSYLLEGMQIKSVWSLVGLLLREIHLSVKSLVELPLKFNEELKTVIDLRWLLFKNGV